MSEEMKLLKALCEAMGFDVEVIEDIKRIYKKEDITTEGEPKKGALPAHIFNNKSYKLTRKGAEK